jgi:rhodanese-related sulfurtransferase
MKIFIIIGGILIVLIATFLLITKESPRNSGETNYKQKLTMPKIEAEMQSGAQLYDVRTPEEFISGYIKGATNVPLTSLQAGELPPVSKDTKIYVYCRSGNRSAQAKSILSKAGFSNITDLGGITDVVAIGGTQTK